MEDHVIIEETFRDMRNLAKELFPWHKRIGIEASIFKSKMYLKGCMFLIKLSKKGRAV